MWCHSSHTTYGQVFTASHSLNYLIYTKCPNCLFWYMKMYITLGKIGLSDSLISCHNLIHSSYQIEGSRLLVIQYNTTTQN